MYRFGITVCLLTTADVGRHSFPKTQLKEIRLRADQVVPGRTGWERGRGSTNAQGAQHESYEQHDFNAETHAFRSVFFALVRSPAWRAVSPSRDRVVTCTAGGAEAVAAILRGLLEEREGVREGSLSAHYTSSENVSSDARRR